MEAGTGLAVTGDDRDMKTETSIISQAQVAALTGLIYTSLLADNNGLTQYIIELLIE